MKAGELGEIAADVGVRDLPRLRVVLQVLCEGRRAAVTTTATACCKAGNPEPLSGLVCVSRNTKSGALKDKNTLTQENQSESV